MSIAGVIAAVVRQEAPYQAEIQMGAQLLLDFQGGRNGGRRYYWYRGTRYASWRKIPGISYSCASENIGENADGSLVKVAPNELCLTDLGVSLWESRQNKVTIFNANPTDLSGVSKSGDAAATLTLVNDLPALSAAGLTSVVTGGQVYKLDNSAGSAQAIATMAGATTVIAPFVVSVFARVGVGSGVITSNLSSEGFTSFSNTAYQRASAIVTPVSGPHGLGVRANAGSIVYFILPDLQEGAYLTPTIETKGAAATRAAAQLSINGVEVILGQYQTNYVPNSAAAGAANGTPGTLPTGWVFGNMQGLSLGGVTTGVTAEGYPSIAYRLTGTPTSTGTVSLYPISISSVSALAGQMWSASVTGAVVAGAVPSGGAVQVWSIETDATSSLGATFAPFTAGATPTRYTVSRTFNNGSSTSARMAISLTGVTKDVLVDVTIMVAACQLQRGPPTDPMITNGAAASVGNPFSLFVSASLPANDNVSRPLLEANDGSGACRVLALRASDNSAGDFAGANGAGGSSGVSGKAGARVLRIATTVNPTDHRAVIDGVLATLAAQIAPAGLNRLDIGSRGYVNQYLNGYVGFVGVFGGLDNTQKQRLAA